jgi:hypothetical protein
VPAVATWAKHWFQKGLLSISDVSLFFAEIVKPFLVDFLETVCENGDIHHWIEFAHSADLSSQFAVIVRQHADKVLRAWNPPSPEALRLIDAWPHVLRNSGDFLYQTIGPKLARRLAIGDVESCLPFMRILPVSLSASLIADSYLAPKVAEIGRLAQTDARAAADAYVRAEASIPMEVIRSRKVTAKLVECLDRLKARNPMLRGLTVEKEPEPATIVDLLENAAARRGRACVPRGSLDGRAVFLIGGIVFGVSDGIVWVQRGSDWRPVFVREIEGLIV